MPSALRFLAGVLAVVGSRALLRRLLLLRFRASLRALNAGDHRPLLAAYADDAVLRFNEGDHRWAGEHRGKPAIERFLRDFAAAGLQGEIVDFWTSGPPWAMTLVARFDDQATRPDGERIYANRTVLVLQTRWGRVVHQEDFYEDTERIGRLDRRLRELGIEPVA